MNGYDLCYKWTEENILIENQFFFIFRIIFIVTIKIILSLFFFFHVIHTTRIFIQNNTVIRVEYTYSSQGLETNKIKRKFLFTLLL